ncbi:MAG: hypothetical protein MUF66_15245, partial [Gammaproteobacteria bacterium]|nr:hypothetical protein [Gammaproteobacteria bacterium]
MPVGDVEPIQRLEGGAEGLYLGGLGHHPERVCDAVRGGEVDLRRTRRGVGYQPVEDRLLAVGQKGGAGLGAERHHVP